MELDSKALKQVLIDSLVELKADIRNGGNPLRIARLDSAIVTLERILGFIQKMEKGEESDMNKLKKELIAKTVTLADIPIRSRSTELTNNLIKIVEELEAEHAIAKAKKLPDEKLPAKAVAGITANHLFAKIKKLKQQGKIGQDIIVRSANSVGYLLKE